MSSPRTNTNHALRGAPAWKFKVLLGATALLLASALGVGLFARGPWAWTVGLVYIVYDTWLLGFMLRRSSAALREQQTHTDTNSNTVQTIAVLIAARNECTALPATLRALLNQDELPERILIIDDGSTDDTLVMLSSVYQVHWDLNHSLGRSRTVPQLYVLKKPNSGKAHSLNRALDYVQEDLVCTLDADTQIERGALTAFRRAFSDEPECWAACGVLTPVCRGGAQARAFQLYQTFEYLRGFLWRLAWMQDQTLVLISGAFACFRRIPLLEAGAFDPSSRVEDYELLFRLYRMSSDRNQPSTVRVIPGARAQTDAPAHIPNFLRQRTRWFAGFIETMFRHHDMVGNRAYGRLGSFHLIIKTIDTLLPLYGLASLLALFAILILGKTLDPIVLAAVIFKLVFDVVCHMRSAVLYCRWLGLLFDRRLLLRSLFATLTEPFAFQLLRQFGALLGWVAFLRGKIDWAPQRETLSSGSMDRSRSTGLTNPQRVSDP